MKITVNIMQRLVTSLPRNCSQHNQAAVQLRNGATAVNLHKISVSMQGPSCSKHPSTDAVLLSQSVFISRINSSATCRVTVNSQSTANSPSLVLLPSGALKTKLYAAALLPLLLPLVSE